MAIPKALNPNMRPSFSKDSAILRSFKDCKAGPVDPAATRPAKKRKKKVGGRSGGLINCLDRREPWVKSRGGGAPSVTRTY